jgi:hypothetical protein
VYQRIQPPIYSFVMPANPLSEETDLLEWLVSWLQSVLPQSWSVAISNRQITSPSGEQVRVDALLDVTSQQSGSVSFLVEAKRTLRPREAEQMFSGIARRYRQLNPYSAPILVVARWLSARTREVLAADGVNYVDTTGNARINVVSPAIFLGYRGADRDPAPDQRGMASVKGARAGRLIRFLTDTCPPYTVSEVASATGLAAGYVSRLLATLDNDALIDRGARGEVTSTNVSGLLRRWTESYSVLKSNRVSSFIAPQGPTELVQRIAASSTSSEFVVTGSFASVLWAPVAAPALLMAYVNQEELVANTFKLLPTDRGANVVLLRPFDAVVWDRTVKRDRVQYAAPSQVAVDCLTGTGRMPSEGEALLSWLTENESSWRSLNPPSRRRGPT